MDPILIQAYFNTERKLIVAKSVDSDTCTCTCLKLCCQTFEDILHFLYKLKVDV